MSMRQNQLSCRMRGRMPTCLTVHVGLGQSGESNGGQGV